MKIIKLLLTLALGMLFFTSCQQDNDVEIYPDLELQEKSITKSKELELFFGSDEFKVFKQFLLKVEMKGELAKDDKGLKEEFLRHSKTLEEKLIDLNLTNSDILSYFNELTTDTVSELYVFGDDGCCQNAAADFLWCKRTARNTWGLDESGVLVVTIVGLIIAGYTGGVGLITLESVLAYFGLSTLEKSLNLMRDLRTCGTEYRLATFVCPCSCESGSPDC